MSTLLAILIPIVAVVWIGGLALIVALCVTSARSDRATRVAVREASPVGERPSGGRSVKLVV
jgi:hypothetical protein